MIARKITRTLWGWWWRPLPRPPTPPPVDPSGNDLLDEINRCRARYNLRPRRPIVYGCNVTRL